VDGCADVGGCLEAPFLIFEAIGKSKNPGGTTLAIFGVFCFIGFLAYVFQPEPPPPPPPSPTLKQRFNAAKDRILHSEPSTTAPVAPVDSTAQPRLRDRAKDWLRNRLNEDYRSRHPEEENK